MVADPKALQYMLHTSGYNFPKAPDASHIIRMLTGDGVGSTKGKSVMSISQLDFTRISHAAPRRSPSAPEESDGCCVFCTPFEGVSHTIPGDCVKGKRDIGKVVHTPANLVLARTEVEG